MATFENFTNLYSLSKTLRFELKPVDKDGNTLSAEESEKLFKEIRDQDQRIKDAYIALKPVMDKIHEEVINTSLMSETAKVIDFSTYYNEYSKKDNEDAVKKAEASLREAIGLAFEKEANELAKNAGNDEKDKPIFKKKKDKDVGIEYLTQAGIIKYIEKNIKTFVPQGKIKEFIDKKNVTNAKGKEITERTGYLAVFDRFFTYFDGYNTNRKNYYAVDEEKATAVASRIVHDNLPKFCDNCIQFSQNKVVTKKKSKETITIPARKDEYLNAYQYLKNENKTTQIKDPDTNTI